MCDKAKGFFKGKFERLKELMKLGLKPINP